MENWDGLEILTAVCLATVQDRAAQMAQRRSDRGQRGGKADIRPQQFLCPGNYRAEMVSRSNVEPMGAGSAGVSDVKTLRDATTRDTAGGRIGSGLRFSMT